jgi:hypothetical protein
VLTSTAAAHVVPLINQDALAKVQDNSSRSSVPSHVANQPLLRRTLHMSPPIAHVPTTLLGGSRSSLTDVPFYQGGLAAPILDLKHMHVGGDSGMASANKEHVIISENMPVPRILFDGTYRLPSAL